MARRGSITEEQVFAAADALVAQGREISPTALLNALGSGSFSTIYKHLSAWEASRASAVNDKAASIPEAVFSAFGAAWRAATVEAGKEVVAVREQAAQDIAAMKAQFQEALQTIERLEAESESDSAKIEVLTVKTTELEKRLHQLESERAAFKATAEQLTQQVRSQEAELDRLHKSSEAEKRSREDAIKEAAQLRGKVEVLHSQNKELLSRLPSQDKQKKS